MHEIKYMEFSRNTTEKEMARARARIVNRNSDWGSRGEEYGNFKLHQVICDSYDDAVEKIRQYDEGWYDDHGVLFRDYGKVKPTKQMEAIKSQISDTRQKRQEFIDAHLPNRVKAELIGCQHCGSKIAKAYLRGAYCPVCHKDLRPKSTLNRIAAYDDKIKTLQKKYAELEKKQKDKAEVKWLVKLEYHC